MQRDDFVFKTATQHIPELVAALTAKLPPDQR